MQTPKMLPWIASRAGISPEHAISLWQKASQEARIMCGCSNNADYFACVMEGFRRLVRREQAAKLSAS